jgi:bifunctional DNA-binding transcriptional regulator/antitoxin component of YhaV-PrlF toxin-antitoxin module
MTTSLSKTGEVIIPDEIRQLDALQPGDDFELRRTAPGRYVLEKVHPPTIRATRSPGSYGHDVLSAPPGSPPLTDELVRELLDEG